METKPQKPSLTYRLAARSLPGVVAEVEHVITRLGRARTLTFRGRKFSLEAFMNALVLEALAMPEAELDKLLASGVARYEAMIDGAKPPTGLSPGGGIIASSSDEGSTLGKPRARKGRTA